MSNKVNTTTVKMMKLLLTSNKLEISKTMGISRPTLDKRLMDHSWKPLEVYYIDNEYRKQFGSV